MDSVITSLIAEARERERRLLEADLHRIERERRRRATEFESLIVCTFGETAIGDLEAAVRWQDDTVVLYWRYEGHAYRLRYVEPGADQVNYWVLETTGNAPRALNLPSDQGADRHYDTLLLKLGELAQHFRDRAEDRADRATS